MKNNIAIFGGSIFINAESKENEYFIIPNKITSKLYEKYNVDNFSNRFLTAERSFKFLKEFVEIKKYKRCIISLGEADYNVGNIDAFKYNLLKIINFLRSKQILPLLVSLPTKFLRKKGASLYQEAIDEIAINENITYVYNGELAIENSYKVKNDSQIKKVLVELCA